MDLQLEHPYWLLLALLPLAYFLWARSQSSGPKSMVQKTAFGLRIAAVLCLLLALASPKVLWPVKEEQILFLVDQSASMQNQWAAQQTFLREAIAAKNANQAIGIYSFSDGFQTDQVLSPTIDALPEMTQMTGGNQTDIENAMKLALGLSDSDMATRVVVLSDGNETNGSLKSFETELKERGVEVDTLVLSGQDEKDVAVVDFQTPTTAFEGESHTLQVTVQSAVEGPATLAIQLNDQQILSEDVTLTEGDNVFTFSNPTEAKGPLVYQATIQRENDAVIQNNELTSLTMVEDTPHVLIVSPDGDSPVPTFIDQTGLVVDSIDAASLPSELASYAGYNAIIFDNVPGHIVGEAKMTVIEQAVKQFGTGFMMVGGEMSYGLGGYFQTPIEKLLPVEMDVKGKHQLPSLALMIVLDRSGSMAGGKLELAKEAAARSVEMLRPEDQFGLIAFDDRPWEIIEPAVITDIDETINTVLSITPGGGTEIYSSLDAAYEKLEKTSVQRKHIILLTDGQSATSNDYESLITDGLSQNITLSTVSIGQDADKMLLETLAGYGSGRFYDVVDENAIPSILSRETAMTTKTYIEDEPFYPTIYSAPGWDNVFNEGVPQLNAYIATTLKPQATLIAESTKEDPVLAEWMYGLGRTIAYTSDSRGAWSGDFALYEKWPLFWNTVITRLLPSIETEPFSVERQEEGVYILSDPSGNSQFFDVQATSNSGEELALESEPIEPGKARIKLDSDPGIVFFTVQNDQQSVFQAGVSIPYSQEYAKLGTDRELMTSIADSTGGQVIENGKDAMRGLSASSWNQQSFIFPLIWLALILFFIDITIRRFGLPSRRRFKNLLKRNEPVAATPSGTSLSSMVKKTRAKRGD
ncbi:VWA domain-containing protein [Chryseomicrobium sp. FSL W7-1435]|uniref:VWA domain-containing protein n=1 Tax=Chryseomicrobium sp. FSL W7-1435 TaxID=2921704 RepID=UPI00315B3FCA